MKCRSGEHGHCGLAGCDAVRFGVLQATNVSEEFDDSIFRVIVYTTRGHISRKSTLDVI